MYETSRSDNTSGSVSKKNMPSVKKNVIYRLAYELLILLTPFITTPYISRVLGADGVGIQSYTASIMSYFTMFAALGTVSYGEREISQNRDDRKKTSKLFLEIELMTVFTSLICILIWVMVIIFNAEYRIYFLALLPMLFATMSDISWYFAGHEQVKYIVLRNAACKIIGIVFLFLFVKKKEDLVLYILANSLINLLGNLSMWTYLPGMLVKVNEKLTFKKHFKETLVYFIPTVATSIYTVLDKTLIGIITKDSYQNGYYEQATKVIKIAKSFVFTAVNAVMGSRIAYLFAQQKYEEIKSRIHKSMNFIYMLGFGAAFGLAGIAENFVPVFFGEGYEPVVQLIYAMTPLILIIGVSNCLGCQYYTPGGYRAKSAKYIVIGSVINLCLNLVMIPFLGSIGAVIASNIAELAITVMYVVNCNGYLTFGNIINFSWKRLIAGIIMCVLVIFIGKLGVAGRAVTLVIQLAAGVCIYIVLLILFRDNMLFEMFRMIKRKISKK